MSTIEEKDPSLTCPVCTELYDRNLHRPKMLKCTIKDKQTLKCTIVTHILCLFCLNNLIEGCREVGDRNTFSCPICRCKHNPPPIGADVNAFYAECTVKLTLTDLLHEQRICKENHKLSKCDSCNALKYAEWWCNSCSMGFCQACHEFHDKLPLKGHKTIPVCDVNWQEIKKKDFCKDHKGEEIIMVCKCSENKTCFICKECADNIHKGHDMKDLHEEAEAKLSKVSSLFDKAKKINMHDLDCKQQLEASKKTLLYNHDAAESRLRACRNHRLKVIKEKFKRDEEKISQITESRKGLIGKELEQNIQRNTTFDNIRNEYDTFHHATSVTILKDTNNLQDALQEFVKNDMRFPQINTYLDLKFVDKPAKFIKNVTDSVEITTMASELEVYYPEVAFQNQRLEFNIQTFSDLPEMCQFGGLPVQVLVHCPCCQVQEVLCPMLTGNGITPGQYVVPFVPRSTGVYKFQVYVEGSETLKHDVCITVYELQINVGKVVHRGQRCEIEACFMNDIDLNIVKKLTAKCQHETGNILENVINVGSKKFSVAFQPNDLGKINISIVIDDFSIARFQTAVYEDSKEYLSTSQAHEIAYIIPEVNRSHFTFLINDGANTLPSMSFIDYDKETMFVLSTVIKEDNTEKRTELTGLFAVGKKSYNLIGVKNPAGFAISSSGLFAVSDCEVHKVIIFRTPKNSENEPTELEPVHFIGEHGRYLGKFNNPTALQINNNGNKLYVCDRGNGRVQELNMLGESLNHFGPVFGDVWEPEAISLSPEGYLVILEKRELVTIDVNNCSKKIVYQVDICCDVNGCSFNHLIRCITDGKVVHLCRRNNAVRVFKYRST